MRRPDKPKARLKNRLGQCGPSADRRPAKYAPPTDPWSNRGGGKVLPPAQFSDPRGSFWRRAPPSSHAAASVRGGKGIEPLPAAPIPSPQGDTHFPDIPAVAKRLSSAAPEVRRQPQRRIWNEYPQGVQRTIRGDRAGTSGSFRRRLAIEPSDCPSREPAGRSSSQGCS